MAGYLERIDSPQDVKALSAEEAETLAQEVRELLVGTVSKTGGHLASNLGVVELTIALHRVFDTARDRLIWDVGHQSYVHKLLTGRRDRIHTLRQLGGLAGFPRREESEHDCFNTGHGSTSISTALGMAKARDLQGGNEAVVAVIGDGAMGGGLAFEALNQAGHLKTSLLVVLNDNEMSIARNVGALAGYLARIRLDPHYLRAKENFEALLGRLKRGPALLEAVERFKSGVKQLLVPGILFEELGWTYLGPIDGHDLGALTEMLGHATTLRGPVLMHVITKKGKGYSFAEEDACRFHGITPFDADSGEPDRAPSQLTFTATFGETLVRLAEQDERIVAVTAAMRDGAGLKGFAERFPQRFFDVGMAEGHAVTFAAGLAARGLRPVVAIYSTFLQRAYDQVVHDVCLQNLPVVLAVDRAGVVGEDGPTHQGAFDLSYLRHIPNLTLMAPRHLADLAAMLATALNLGTPAAIRYPRCDGGSPANGDELQPLPVGKGELLRAGSDLAYLCVGPIAAEALAAAQALAEQGLEAAVADLKFVKPLDEELVLELAGRCRRLITVEENQAAGGMGSAVLELLAAHPLAPEARVQCVGLPDRFTEHGARRLILAQLGLCAPALAERGRSLVATAQG